MKESTMIVIQYKIFHSGYGSLFLICSFLFGRAIQLISHNNRMEPDDRFVTPLAVQVARQPAADAADALAAHPGR
jgi:hypothetical protein